MTTRLYGLKEPNHFTADYAYQDQKFEAKTISESFIGGIANNFSGFFSVSATIYRERHLRGMWFRSSRFVRKTHFCGSADLIRA